MLLLSRYRTLRSFVVLPILIFHPLSAYHCRSVAVQLVYEIGDPGAYHVPDVACDFTAVQMEQVQRLRATAAAPHPQRFHTHALPTASFTPVVSCRHGSQVGAERVRVAGVRGQPPSDTYKVTSTYFDGWRNEALLVIAGMEADRKAQATGDALFKRTRAMLRAAGLADYTETRIEIIGAETMFGANATVQGPREVGPRHLIMPCVVTQPDPHSPCTWPMHAPMPRLCSR